MSKRIGPSMSTEPGWMTAVRARPSLLGDHNRPRSQNDPSMLLSFESPVRSGSFGAMQPVFLGWADWFPRAP